MKKKSLILAILMVFSLVLFSACGIVGSEQVTAVRFSTNRVVDINNGGSSQKIKCFTIGVGEEFEIPYQIYPNSAAAGARVVFSHMADNADNNKFELNFLTGKFKIVSNDFPEEGIRVSVTVNTEYTDVCVIKKMEYTDSVLAGDNADYIAQNAFYTFSVLDNTTFDPIDASLRNFYIESSDDSIIKVENHQGLTVRSTGKRGSAKVTINYISDGGKLQKIGSKILTVMGNSSQTKVAIDGNIINGKNITMLSSDALHQVNFYMIDSEGYVISGVDFEINVVMGSIVVDEMNSHAFKAKIEGAAASEKCIIEIVTNVRDLSGEIIKIRLNIELQKDAG